MNPIEGVDLQKVNENAAKGFSKIAEARLTDYLRGLRIQAHNLTMKANRLRNEAEQAESSRAKIDEQIGRIVAGDWSAVEPFEVADKSEKPA